MPEIEVCLTPELLPLYQVEGKTVVVIDVLRATSCMTAGLASGVDAIVPVATLEECKFLQDQGYVGAAERGGQQAEGFNMGNSPFSFMDTLLKGRKIAMTTTNGTLAITRSKASDQILIGSFLNLDHLASYLAKQSNDLLLLCAGWKGRFSLEDTLCAGGLVDQLQASHKFDDDSVLAAKTLYSQAKSDLFNFVSRSSHFRRLSRLNIVKDIEFCLTPNQFEVIPVLKGQELVDSGF